MDETTKNTIELELATISTMIMSLAKSLGSNDKELAEWQDKCRETARQYLERVKNENDTNNGGRMEESDNRSDN